MTANAGERPARANRGAEDRKRQGLVLMRSVAENVALTALRSSLSKYGFVRLRERARVVSDLIERLRLVPARPDAAASSLSGLKRLTSSRSPHASWR